MAYLSLGYDFLSMELLQTLPPQVLRTYYNGKYMDNGFAYIRHKLLLVRLNSSRRLYSSYTVPETHRRQYSPASTVEYLTVLHLLIQGEKDASRKGSLMREWVLVHGLGK